MSDDEFWHLTLAQLNELVKRYNDKLKLEDYHFALIGCVLAEINRDRKKRTKPFTLQDFTLLGKQSKSMTDDQMKEQIELINMALGGKKKRGK